MCLHPAAESAAKAFGAPVEWGADPFSGAARAAYAELVDLARAVATGALSIEGLEERMMAVLLAGHEASHYAGQEMSGFRPSQVLAARRGRQVALAQNSFVRGLVTALDGRDPRYWDEGAEEWRSLALEARMASYTGRMRGTATDGWVAAAPAQTLYAWRLGGAEEHCADCPTLAADGPYLGQGGTDQLAYPILYTKPGECDTPCLFNCKCRLERLSDGALSPEPFRFAS